MFSLQPYLYIQVSNIRNAGRSRLQEVTAAHALPAGGREDLQAAPPAPEHD